MFLNRLYALMVGVDNFLVTPATVIGLTTVSRVRSDFDEMIATIEQQGLSCSRPRPCDSHHYQSCHYRDWLPARNERPSSEYRR